MCTRAAAAEPLARGVQSVLAKGPKTSHSDSAQMASGTSLLNKRLRSSLAECANTMFVVPNYSLGRGSSAEAVRSLSRHHSLHAS